VTDPFDTAAIRRRVLQGWAASPARFREDANAEEDLALGAYRDRLVVELAQNAADAATRADQPGRLRLTLRGNVLVAANTGAPLDAPGVEALSTLRASAKRDAAGIGAVGRFGVGFAAVLAVTDEPAMLSRPGGVRWSLGDARALALAEPALADELTRREGHVPLLRLPFAAEGRPPEGYDTAVVLPLRDAAAGDLARRLLLAVDDALLLGLDGLAEVDVEVDGEVRALTARRDGPYVLVEDDGTVTRWHVVRRSGRLDPQLLADRPIEERARPVWSLAWAVPVADDRPRPLPSTTPPVVHAPTPTDEPLQLPALLLATFPLDPSRRHVAPGRLRRFLVERAAEAYADLLRELPGHASLLRLVPGPMPAGELDAEIHRAVLVRLVETPFLPAAQDTQIRLRPHDAVAVEGADDALVAALAPVLPGLLPSPWARDLALLRRLEVRIATVAEVVDQLAEVRREPGWWRELYGAVAAVDSEALHGLPVPLADGRMVRDPRGVLLPAGPDDAAALGPLGLRVAHPEAVHPVLERLGAVPATPLAVLSDPAVPAVAEAAWDADDPGEVTDAVLRLVAAAGLVPGELPWLAELPLPDSSGELCPAGELLLPGSPLAGVVAAGALGVVDGALADRWGEQVLEAVGVLRSFAVVRDHDVSLQRHAVDHYLDGEDDWVAAARALLPAAHLPPVVTEFVAVRDLDLVDPAAWPAALRLLSEPPLREAVTAPTRVALPDGRAVDVPSYAAWWLRTHPVLDGHRPADLALQGSDRRLSGLYGEAEPTVDTGFARALGVRVSLDELLAEPSGREDLLDRLSAPGRSVGRTQLREIYAALARAGAAARAGARARIRAAQGGPMPIGSAQGHLMPMAPTGVRVPDGAGTRVVPADRACVVDAPDLLPFLSGRPSIAAPPDEAAALADVLGLPLASEEITALVESSGAEVPVPEVVRRVLPHAPRTYVEHDRLVAAGVEVDWRCVDGVVHAATTEGLACGLAWVAGAWERRLLVAALLVDPDHADELFVYEEFSKGGPTVVL
jgi:hypothetical protein